MARAGVWSRLVEEDLLCRGSRPSRRKAPHPVVPMARGAGLTAEASAAARPTEKAQGR